MDVEVIVPLIKNLSCDNLMLDPLLIVCRTLLRAFPNATVEVESHLPCNSGGWITSTGRLTTAKMLGENWILANPLPVVESLQG